EQALHSSSTGSRSKGETINEAKNTWFFCSSTHRRCSAARWSTGGTSLGHRTRGRVGRVLQCGAIREGPPLHVLRRLHEDGSARDSGVGAGHLRRRRGGAEVGGQRRGK